MHGDCRHAVSVLALVALALPVGALALTPAEDADLDNMLDTWELANGLNPADPLDADLDNDFDGVPNKGEYHLGSDPNDGASIPALNANYLESFEAGTIPLPWFTPTGDYGFSAESITAWDGSWSVVSDSIPYYNQANLVLPIFVPKTELDFRFYLNTNGADQIRVYVDDSLEFTANTFPRAWRPSDTLVLEPGYHEIRFNYFERSSLGYGCMCLRLDDIRFTSLDTDLDGIPDEDEILLGMDPNDPSDALLDLDSDGLANVNEWITGTDLLNPDSDGDGLTDGDEVNTYGTSPLSTDSDADNLSDDVEIAEGLDPLDSNDAQADADGDGISNYGEYQLGTDMNDPASVPSFVDSYAVSFEDGMLPPGWSVPVTADGGFTPTTITSTDGNWSIQSDQISPSGEQSIVQFAQVHHLSDLSFDIYMNSENVSFQPEFMVLMDGEVIYEVGAIPRGWVQNVTLEVPSGYHEYQLVFDRYDTYGCRCVRIDDVRITKIDNDEDGMRDSWETVFDLDPNDPSDAGLDPDDDGLTNLEEYNNNTAPLRADSDFDGLSDGTEINTTGTDPLDADSDNDLMRDDFEIANGLDPLAAADADLDLDGDTFSNVVEYRLESDASDAGSVPALTQNIFESFEGALPLAWYTPSGGTAEWYLTGDDQTDGSFSFRSRPHPEGVWDYKTVELLVYVVEGTLQFDYRNVELSGSSSSNRFRVYVDGSVRQTTSFNTGNWRTVSLNLSEGLHRIQFQHYGNRAGNHVYIDNLAFVPTDGDNNGIRDLYELDNGLDPTDPSDAAADIDSDGLSNLEEFWLGTAASLTDTDGDGLSDLDEVRIYGTRPTDPDDDNDEIDDGYEVANGLDPRDAGDKNLDLDNDGVSNYGEFRLGTLANDPASTPPFTDNLTESFEAGVIPVNWYEPINSDAAWFPENITAWDGSWSLRSGEVEAGNISFRDSEISIPVVVHESDFQFRYYYHSGGSDRISVYIDGELAFFANETNEGPQHYWKPSPVFRLSEGFHEIRIQFTKFNYGRVACRCVRIDDLQFTLVDTDTDRLPTDWETQYGLDPNDAADAALDLDGDGLSNLDEWLAGTLPDTPDTDGDGVTDGAEDAAGTNPLNADSDNDEMSDGYEISNGLDPNLATDAYRDADGDGVHNVGEMRLGRDPNVADALPAYNDNYTEGFESGVLPPGWFTPANTDETWEPTSVTSRYGSWSLESNGIGSGENATIVLPLTTHLSDFEFFHYWNAREGDNFRVYINGRVVYDIESAARGWIKGPVLELPPGYNEIRFEHTEATGGYGCQCTRIDGITVTRVDADGDGLRDSYETANGLDPADPADGLVDLDGDGLTLGQEIAAGSDPANIDTDGDGLNDGAEVNIWFTDPASLDSDGDFLPDGWEVANGLDPSVAANIDSDGDSYLDRDEFVLGSDPQDPASVPAVLGTLIESFEGGSLPGGVWWDPTVTDAIVPSTEWSIQSDNASDGLTSLATEPLIADGGADVQLRQIAWTFNTNGSTLLLDHDMLSVGSTEFLDIQLDGGTLDFRSWTEGGGWRDTRRQSTATASCRDSSHPECTPCASCSARGPMPAQRRRPGSIIFA